MHVRKSTKPRVNKPTPRPSTAAEGAGPRSAGGIEVVRALADVVRRRTLVQIRFRTLDGSVRKSVLAMPEFWTYPAFTQRMIDEEFPLPNNREEITQLHTKLKRDAEHAAQDPSLRVDTTPLQGWHGDAAFVLGKHVVPKGAAVVFHPAEGIVYPQIAQCGTFEGWRDGVAAALPCSSRLMLAACAALAAALLRVWRGQVAGFGFDFSGGSRAGKTTALRVARSMLGAPDLDGWNITRAGSGQYLLGHRGLPVILDGTSAARPGARDAASIVEQVTDLIAGGRPDRLHAGSMGGLEKAGVGFESILLCSTEGALSGRQRGHQARLVEMPLPAAGFGIVDRPELCGPPVTDAASAGRWVEALVEAAWKHHGYAHRRFVGRLLKFGDTLEAEVHALMNIFRKATPEADGDAWARSMRDNFALGYAAGSLACQFGIFPFGPEAVLDALRRCLLDALAHAAAPALAAAALAEADAAAIRAWLHANWEVRANAEKPGFDARGRRPKDHRQQGYRQEVGLPRAQGSTRGGGAGPKAAGRGVETNCRSRRTPAQQGGGYAYAAEAGRRREVALPILHRRLRPAERRGELKAVRRCRRLRAQLVRRLAHRQNHGVAAG